MVYKQTQKDQNWLLPLSIREMIPADHVCFLVEDFVEGLDYGKYEYDEKKNEFIADGLRYRFRWIYTRKNWKKIVSFYNEEIKRKKDVPFYFRERLRMKEKMNTDESRKIHSLRKITVEPVYGHIKQNLGFREFLLHGLDGVKIEIT